jgi:hypothetical protein
MNVKSVIRLVVRACYVSLLFLATLEISARVEAKLRWGAPLLGPYSSDALQGATDSGPNNRPGARFEKWSINSAGFRGPELAATKAAGVVRVGIAGASEVFGLYESPEMDVTAQLRARLAEAAPGRFEVVNLASAGMSLPRMRELIERWAARFDFDVIVVYPTPAFYLEDQPPRRASQPRRTTPPGPTPRSALRLPNKVWQAARQSLPAVLQAWLKEREIEKSRQAHPPGWVWREAPAERVALFESDLREVVVAVEQVGALPVLATHAHRFRAPLQGAERHQMVGWIRFYPRATAECLLDMEQQANVAVRRVAVEKDLAVIDVQAAVGKDAGRYADFSHFTDAGATRAAAAIAAELLGGHRSSRVAGLRPGMDSSALPKDQQVRESRTGQPQPAKPE